MMPSTHDHHPFVAYPKELWGPGPPAHHHNPALPPHPHADIINAGGGESSPPDAAMVAMAGVAAVAAAPDDVVVAERVMKEDGERHHEHEHDDEDDDGTAEPVQNPFEEEEEDDNDEEEVVDVDEVGVKDAGSDVVASVAAAVAEAADEDDWPPDDDEKLSPIATAAASSAPSKQGTAAAATASPKGPQRGSRKRKGWSVAEKKAACLKYRQGTYKSQAQFLREYNSGRCTEDRINKANFQRWWNDVRIGTIVLDEESTKSDKLTKRKRKGRYEMVEKRLREYVDWVNENRMAGEQNNRDSRTTTTGGGTAGGAGDNNTNNNTVQTIPNRGIGMTESALQKKAEEFARQVLSEEEQSNFKASSGWVWRFCKRYREEKNIESDTETKDLTVVERKKKMEKFRKEVARLAEKHEIPLEHWFSSDQTGLIFVARP